MSQRKLITSFLMICFGLIGTATGQKVTVSKALSIRNDFSYEIVGVVNNSIILVRDRGLEYEMEVFNEDMSHRSTYEMVFEKRKINLLGSVSTDTSFLAFYSFRHKDSIEVRCRNYDNQCRLLDSLLVFKRKKVSGLGSYFIELSEDKSKTLIYTIIKNRYLESSVFDNKTFELLTDDSVDLDDYNLKKDFKNLVVTNSGDVWVLLEKHNTKFKRKEHKATILHLSLAEDKTTEYDISFEEYLTTDATIKYDETNGGIIIAGLYNDDNNNDALGYYFYRSNDNLGKKTHKFSFVPFGEVYVAEVTGKKANKEERLSNFSNQDIILTQDGGFVLIAEMNREHSRRSTYGSPGTFRGGYGRGSWIDYNNEDLTLINIDGSGVERWKTVLYKKQFSQDDDAAYSSYFPFITNSRLRLLYNDEIRKNSTVSEYVIDPLGQSERNAVMSTDDQSLKLRLREALQVSASELIVPSERKYKLNLVKISY